MSAPVDPRLPRTVPAVRRQLAALVALQFAGALLVVAQAALLAEIVATVVLHGTAGLGALGRPLLLLVGVGVGRAVLGAGQEWVGARSSERVRADLRGRVLAAVVRLGPTWAAAQPSGRLVTAAGPGLDALDGYLTRALPAMVAAGVVPPFVVARIGLADWQSAAILVGCLPLVPLFMVLVGVTTRRRMATQYALLARLAGHFLDLVQGLTSLKVYGRARAQVDTVRRATDAYRRHTLATLKVAFLSGLVLDVIATLSVAVVAVDVGLRLDHGGLSLRTALLVLLLAPELFAPLRAVGAQYHAAEEGRVAAGAALDVLDEAAAVSLADGVVAAAAGPAPRSGTALSVRGLSVHHAGRGAPALDRLDLDVPAGQVLAVRGPSGGGKSTLLGVLLGFVAPSAGAVYAGGRGADPGDAVVLDSDAWRAHTAWVPQRPTPTQPTVSAEVALGDPSATAAQLAQAVADCRAPAGDTPLGEDGVRVSAGQRRRVALARALLRARAVHALGEVPLLLLDEPSEDLDPVTEQVVASVIGSLAGWATVVMVTHSDALAAVAERTVELRDGRIESDRAIARPVRPALPTPGPVERAVPMTAVAGPAPAAPARLRTLLDVDPALRRRLVIAAVLSGATGLAALALTATSVWLICRASQHPNVQALEVAVVGVRTFALARALLRYGDRLVAHDVALRLLAQVRARVFAALEPLAPTGLAGLARGDLLRRFVGDVDAIQDGLVRAVLPLAGAAITAGGAAALAVLVLPAAGTVLAAGLVAALVVAAWFTRRAAGSGRAVAAAVGERDRRSTALLAGLAELTAYGAARRALAGVGDADTEALGRSRRPAAAAALGAGLTGLVSATTLPAVLAVTVQLVAGGGVDPLVVGALLACVLTGFEAVAPLPAAFAAWGRLRASLARVATLLATPAPVPEPAGTVPAAPSDRTPVGVAADGVDLAPATGADLVIRDADLALAPGRRIAVTGPSGCGKSTLLTAAMRLLPVQRGRLDLTSTAGRTPLAQLPAAAVPPLVAGSLQGDHVFDTSLRDNLRVVRPEATDADLGAAARRAGLAEFVTGLPDGWDTAAGPDGGALSGGQRQRLLLARALLADPAVLVLDEPTAHLDPDTERAVLADLLAATAGRTVLLTTHRRVPVERLDAVLAVVDGRLRDVTPVAGTA
ncbi:ATP-binding cassette, subfamily C, CydCD [Jatrophihabitans endophyticus]|uniref:ATP-binding cassette, subfamily C, CydCD n=1 Tax=Jatrophihabitans endophyticus TaxID=1206085 RepID=A0A1M5CIN9_9ACTN|nr:thiol reductant ABC exporter subunit CydD [Jatrophihabitans endophyticus]SHF54645.1 ATP-binding cassette, subfamily C, CydCD [Jatrophihabitans endophyticus]